MGGFQTIFWGKKTQKHTDLQHLDPWWPSPGMPWAPRAIKGRHSRSLWGPAFGLGAQRPLAWENYGRTMILYIYIWWFQPL